MTPRGLKLETISPEAFAPFGSVVDWTDELERSGEPFHVVVSSAAPTGWRMAILKVRERTTSAMENHPGTEELFAPVSGVGVLLVARRGAFDPQNVRAFLLDRPVSVAPGVWHGNVTVSEWTTVLIAENLEVDTEYAELDEALGARLA
ncbi:MAG: ureidoglycolate lyase [Anaerolineae bacterium]